MSSAIVTEPPTEDLQLIPQPVLPPKPKKRRASCRRTKTGCITCRRRGKKCDEHKPLCSTCVRAGHRCEGYQKPGDVRLPVAPAMPRPLRPFERDTSVKSRDQFIAADRSQMLVKLLDEPPYLRCGIPESRASDWSFSHHRLGDPSVSSIASSNQHPLSMHAVSPPYHPTPQDWTIPSIHQLLQDTHVGNELPPVAN